MKKYIIFLLISIFFYGLGTMFNPFKKNRIEKMESKKEYTFIGSYNDTLVSDNYRSDLAEITYTKGTDPYGVYNLENGIVATPYLAYIIAKAILENIYGYKHIKEEFPLQISLVNNKFWVINGTLHQNSKGGVATIVIKKDDGQIQYVKHEK